ncbi:MAG TPA: CotH kinase family protein [Urbifossiella sp.]|nr:CotH kinase family protein [Urbifossiella sp.]
MRYIPLLAAAAVLVAWHPEPAAAQKAKSPAEEVDAFFAAGRPVQLVIEVGQKESDSLRREHRKYVPATVKEGGNTYKDVGIHLRGAIGSFRPFDDKPGLTLNMDKFADGQRWHGMDKFHLANSAQDPSYLSEEICGELMQAVGVPAARIGHAAVTVNGRPRGFYYLKEGFDKGFLQKHFKNSNGNFYDGGFCREIDQPLELVSGKGDVADRGDLKALIAATREGDHKRRIEQLARLLDLDQFISYMVMSAITWDWDGYPFKANNYRIYHDPVRNKLIFIPSGMDQMFGDPNGPALPGFGGMVARSIIETTEGRRRYWVRMREVMRTVFEPERWVKRLDELQARIQSALTATDAGAGRGLKDQVDRLRNGIRQRHRSITEQLARVKE